MAGLLILHLIMLALEIVAGEEKEWGGETVAGWERKKQSATRQKTFPIQKVGEGGGGQCLNSLIACPVDSFHLFTSVVLLFVFGISPSSRPHVKTLARHGWQEW